jgi:hypothetical protein
MNLADGTRMRMPTLTGLADADLLPNGEEIRERRGISTPADTSLSSSGRMWRRYWSPEKPASHTEEAGSNRRSNLCGRSAGSSPGGSPRISGGTSSGSLVSTSE